MIKPVRNPMVSEDGGLEEDAKQAIVWFSEKTTACGRTVRGHSEAKQNVETNVFSGQGRACGG